MDHSFAVINITVAVNKFSWRHDSSQPRRDPNLRRLQASSDLVGTLPRGKMENFSTGKMDDIDFRPWFYPLIDLKLQIEPLVQN